MARLPLTEGRVRQLLLKDKYIVGDHAVARIKECSITDVHAKIQGLARHGVYSRRFSQYGECAMLADTIGGSEYRLIVGPHWNTDDSLFVITFYRADPGLLPGKSHQKFEGRTRTYYFDGPRCA